MHQLGNRLGQSLLAFPPVRLFLSGLIQGLDLFPRQLRQKPEALPSVLVGDVDPGLVKGVRAGPPAVEPEGAARVPAHPRAVTLGERRTGDAIPLRTPHPAAEVDPPGQVAPLVAPAD